MGEGRNAGILARMSAKHENNEMDTPRDPRGIRHKRGYLPHIDAPGLTQFVTFRLDGSLPKSIFETLKFKFETKQIDEIEYHEAIDKALDACDGPLHLKLPQIAKIVSYSILHFAGKRYILHAWVVMPNHVHLLLELFEELTLSSVIHSIKSYSASQANKILQMHGRFWSPDYFDRFIRGAKHFAHVKKYIEDNPVKAGLCKTPEE